jgi:MFS family permease
MNAATAELAPSRTAGVSWLWRRQLSHYPDTWPRAGYLAITVLATITLYYELYVGGSVSTLILANLHMTFTFFAVVTAFGSLIGAFGSLLAGLADRYGRANLVVFGLLFAAVFVTFLLPNAHTKWTFSIEGFVVGFVEGICLVATPALIRDFSPQVGRATAMGFWTSGPVLGSLIVAIVGSATIPVVIHNPRFWTHEYYICGIVGLAVFLIALVGLRELSPQLRDQLMVTMRDRALIEIRAKGLDVEAALRHPFRQLIKPDVVISAFAIAVFLLIYYAAVGFLVIYMTTAFPFTIKAANGLGNWEWGANAAAVILIGALSDRLRVRKPFMVFGAVAGAVMTVVFLEQFGHHPSYYTMAIILAASSICLGIAYVTWMASFTETVEARNPALIATGLAIWGWIIRVVVFASTLIIPVVVTSVTPLVQNGTQVVAYAAQYKSQFAFAQAHPAIVATAQKYSTQLANAQRFAPELAVLQAHPALFGRLAAYPNPANAPASLLNAAIKAAGGGTKGVDTLEVIGANGPIIQGVIAVAPQLATLKPYAAQLTALSKIPPSVTAFMSANVAPVQRAAAETAGQWKHWFWVCFGGIIFFLLSIPLLRGRWRPKDARQDEQRHEAMVAAELAKLSPEPATSA